MSSYMESEVFLFLLAVGTGAALLLLYRLLGIFRLILPDGKVVPFLDLLYWLFAGCAVFAEIYQYNEGVLRFFLLPAVLSGAFFANYVLKRLLFYAKRGKILIIMKKRFCNLKRGKQIEKGQKKEKKCENIK